VLVAMFCHGIGGKSMERLDDGRHIRMSLQDDGILSVNTETGVDRG